MSDNKWPQRIEAFLTSDREMHRSLAVAEDHQRRLDGARLATELLEGGETLRRALRSGNLIPDGCYPELDDVTKDTKLVISHWQCKDTPGYSPLRVRFDGMVWVWGDAGSWSGPYGNWCSASEVVSYLKNTRAEASR